MISHSLSLRLGFVVVHTVVSSLNHVTRFIVCLCLHRLRGLQRHANLQGILVKCTSAKCPAELNRIQPTPVSLLRLLIAFRYHHTPSVPSYAEFHLGENFLLTLRKRRIHDYNSKIERWSVGETFKLCPNFFRQSPEIQSTKVLRCFK